MMPGERLSIRFLADSVVLLALGLGLGFLVYADAPGRNDATTNLQSGNRKQSPAPGERIYQNRLKPLLHPQPLLADYPEFVQPVIEKTRATRRPC